MEFNKLKRNKQIGVKKVEREGLKSIKTSKIVVPLYKKDFPEPIQKVLEERAKAHGKDFSGDFIVVRLYEINSILSKRYPGTEPITWNHILHFHLVKWIIIKTNGLFEDLTIFRVNLLLDSYFSYMPFIRQRMWPNVNKKFGEGFDKELEAKDYKRNDYAMHRLRESFKHQIVDPLREIEIIEVE